MAINGINVGVSAAFCLLVLTVPVHDQENTPVCDGVMILPQNGGKLRLVLNNSAFIRFNDTQLDSETSYFQTLKDMKIILSYDYNDHNKTFIFDSESSGSIEITPEYSCATINLPLGSPVDPENGHVEYRYQTSGTGDTITIAEFTCNEGYSLNGSETVVFDTTWTWRWNGGTEPVCEANSLPTTRPPISFPTTRPLISLPTTSDPPTPMQPPNPPAEDTTTTTRNIIISCVIVGAIVVMALAAIPSACVCWCKSRQKPPLSQDGVQRESQQNSQITGELSAQSGAWNCLKSVKGSSRKERIRQPFLASEEDTDSDSRTNPLKKASHEDSDYQQPFFRPFLNHPHQVPVKVVEIELDEGSHEKKQDDLSPTMTAHPSMLPSTSGSNTLSDN